MRELTPEDRAARDDWPRPGMLIASRELDESIRRTFTQDETDALIRRELVRRAAPGQHDELVRIVGTLGEVDLEWPSSVDPRSMVRPIQRGGIDTDPLVRVLAYRAWGDRDRRWFEDRGVRKGDRVTVLRYDTNVVATAWHGERVWFIADADQPAGALFRSDGVLTVYRVNDRLRVEPDE